MKTQIIIGDVRERIKELADDSVHCVVTSPPYFGLRDYGMAAQIGLEPTPDAYVAEMVSLFREVRRVLRSDGTFWLNLGDSYANDTKWGGQTSGKHVNALQGNIGIGRRRQNTGLKSKDLIGIPWRVAFALQADGWYLRQDIIWSKPNPMPESIKDRCTKSHEYMFLLTKGERYFFDHEAIKEPLARPDEANRKTPGKFGGANKHVEAGKQSRLHSGNEYLGTSDGKRNKRSVWTITPKPFRGAHFATFPPDLVRPCILAGCPVGGTVLDPFFGAGTTGLVATELGRNCIGFELNPEYARIAQERLGLPIVESPPLAPLPVLAPPPY